MVASRTAQIEHKLGKNKLYTAAVLNLVNDRSLNLDMKTIDV